MTGWIGNAFILLGIFAVAHRKRYGFILGITGNSLWCLRGAVTHQWDLIVIEVIIVILQAYSWWKWGHVGTTCKVCDGTGRGQ